MKGIENPPGEKPRLFACLIPHVGHDFIGKPGRRLNFVEAGQQGVRLPISGHSARQAAHAAAWSATSFASFAESSPSAYAGKSGFISLHKLINLRPCP